MRMTCALVIALAACGGPAPSPQGMIPVTYTEVLKPTYGISVAAVRYTTDAKGVVTSDPSTAPGPVLVAGSVLGQDYATLSGSCPALTFEALGAAFVSPVQIDAPIKNAALGLVLGAQLPYQGCVIPRNCFMGVCAYQVIQVTFTPN